MDSIPVQSLYSVKARKNKQSAMPSQTEPNQVNSELKPKHLHFVHCNALELLAVHFLC